MLVVLILKAKYSILAKHKDNDELNLCLVKKVTSLNFRTDYDEWYIIPTISISFNCGVDIEIKWLKISYSNYWSVVTYEDEDEYAEFIRYRNNKNE